MTKASIKYYKLPAFPILILLFALYYLGYSQTTLSHELVSISYFITSILYFWILHWYYGLVQNPYTKPYKKHTMPNPITMPLITLNLPPKARKKLITEYPELLKIEKQIKYSRICLLLTPFLTILGLFMF